MLNSPAVLILAVAVVATVLSTSVSSLLFFWRFETRYVVVGSSIILAVIYGGLFAMCIGTNEPLFFLQTSPTRGWDGLGVLVGQYVAGVAGLALGFLFMAIARIAHFFDDRQQSKQC